MAAPNSPEIRDGAFDPEEEKESEAPSAAETAWRLQQPPAWKVQLAAIADTREQKNRTRQAAWPPKRQVVYQIDVPASNTAGTVVLILGTRDQRADGGFTRVADLKLQRNGIERLSSAEDRKILATIAGASLHVPSQFTQWGGSFGSDQIPSSCVLTSPLATRVIPDAIRTGRCFFQPGRTQDSAEPLRLDEGEPWQFELDVKRNRDRWVVDGFFRRTEEQLGVRAPVLVTPNFLFTQDKAAKLAGDPPMEWIAYLRRSRSIEAPDDDGEELLENLLRTAGVSRIGVPAELQYDDVTLTPRPFLRLRVSSEGLSSSAKLGAQLSFSYDGHRISAEDPSAGYFDASARRFLRRNVRAEQVAAELLMQLGFRLQETPSRETEWELAVSKLLRAVRVLVEAGWHIDADGKVFRQPGAFRLDVSTGVDWFELRGEIDYGDTRAKLPELIEALKRGHSAVRLEDGTYGLLSEDWLQRIGMLIGMGTAEADYIRFRWNQAGVLDALLLAQGDATWDETFSRVREQLRSFDGIKTVGQPAEFVGHLRDYQREGLAWMEFLRRFSFGGCLADDMGVGKTAQVLAMLETRRASKASGETIKPSLVVVPKSLVFNWKLEAARFTPKLRVLDYTGASRSLDDLNACDLMLTTYGTLRRDIVSLKDVHFDYVVLDEAQIVKNSSTESAKTVRLLQAQHRLALSGTPIENHVGELFALIDFLNPGMLGTTGVFKLVGVGIRTSDQEALRLLARTVRPFILRRTKEQVARELPAKTEQTIYCELEPDQRKLYDELRQHYRLSLLKRIDEEGLAKSKIHVLEALLRLRQAACHPGLIDTNRIDEPSAKTDALLERLREIREEGHKALVFSQFTSLLKIVRDRLDKDGVAYEYLDGATRNREEVVERFQNDPDCRLFLISLKAGGLGLNLTAAEYVFLLDPWWNPAIEAQAVDRAHRIGQTRHVFAYRLIARDTVEEKVLELQKTKKDLADAIISADNNLIRDLRAEDLELLLS
ncbi:MAG TPA: DEAD/DEAH box helicase [Bryobacteraceae bacterium]|jgi:superfamily II DNA or RNA helicase|nr:DEAD/DEAH box helicase [Bryobacteraceae bacterium]